MTAFSMNSFENEIREPDVHPRVIYEWRAGGHARMYTSDILTGGRCAMATTRPRPYSQFNFLVDLGVAGGPHAGFEKFSNVNKITGLNKSTDVTLKRGVIGSTALQDWLTQIKKAPKKAQRTVKIALRDEEHETVRTWKLLDAAIVKYTGPPLNAKGTDVAIEELVLSCERIEVKP